MLTEEEGDHGEETQRSGRGVSLGLWLAAMPPTVEDLERMRRRQPERVLSVAWGSAGEHGFEVDVEIHAYDRHGLVRDVGAVLTEEKINILRMTTTTHAATNTADIHVAISIRGLEELSHLLTRLTSVRNVVSARRRT